MNALEDLLRLMREGRMGHAYLIDGDPVEAGRRFAEEVVVSLYRVHTDHPEPRVRHRVTERLHPDVHWVEPRGKLRQIKVDDVAAALKRIHEKSFEGGWKVVGFLGAERLNPGSGNKLLKSLEEPPPRTLLLLVTASPERLLPTLRSRCQFLVAARGRHTEAEWMPALLDLLRAGPPRSLRARLDRAAAFRDFFEEAARARMEAEADPDEADLEEDVENARATTVRRRLQRGVLAAVEAWYRDVLVIKHGGDASGLRYPEAEADLRAQADSLPVKSIRRLLENTDRAARGLEGNLPVQVVLEGAIF